MGFLLDPDAVLDFAISWVDWLAAGETITAFTCTPSSGVQVNSATQAGGIVTVWLSHGVPGTATVTCHITTSAGRQDDRTLSLRIIDR